MSAPMVQAILDGRKTQTRRVVKFKPELDVTSAGVFCAPGKAYDDLWAWLTGDPQDSETWEWRGEPFRCPYGVPGDRLWVRETWAHYQTVNQVRRNDGRSFSEISDGLAAYRADGHDSISDLKEHIRVVSGCDLEAVEVNGDRWRPSIHMPRWACRIVLEITEVRVERLQDISEVNAVAEGCKAGDGSPENGFPTEAPYPARAAFAGLWDSINGDGSFERNDFVWALTFKRIK